MLIFNQSWNWLEEFVKSMRKTNNVIKIKDFKVDKGLPFDQEYNFAYLDENTKKMIRRAIIKALCIPGYQVPFASREMPMPYGWGNRWSPSYCELLNKKRHFKNNRSGS